MKKITLALAAHVDAGKTTLAEALLHQAGVLRVPGRVDQGNTALDFHETERRRGITVFAGEASFVWQDTEINLLDTPGHVDFAPEAERALMAADAALLIISGLDGVQAHTRSLWKLMEQQALPVLIFVSKMDSGRWEPQAILAHLRQELGAACLPWEQLMAGGEETALLEENLLEEYLAGQEISRQDCLDLVRRRRAFPVFFGSGLKEDGLEGLQEAAVLLAQDYAFLEQMPFRGLVYKIDFDEKGNRQAHMKLLSGSLAPRDTIMTGEAEEKLSFLRQYTGSRFRQAEALSAGSIGVVLGLKGGRAGQELGTLAREGSAFFEPLMRYAIRLPEGVDADAAYQQLLPLGEEDPSLHLHFSPGGGLSLDLMGPVQQEILIERIKQQSGWDVGIEAGQILYKETLLAPVEGVGHYEPLRHYAEVHLALRPLPRGQGIVIRNETDARSLPPEVAEGIIKLLALKQHRGVLGGFPLTDVEIALLGAKTHEKHTEGGDLREAALRAVRQGLMQAAAQGAVQLLEPWQGFTLQVPADKLGRALSDIRARAGEAEQESQEENLTRMKGRAPAAALAGYERELAAYTAGRGQWSLWAEGYAPCHNPEAVLAETAYQPEADRENPCDSVFCAHGAGFSVPWDQVPAYMHLPFLMKEARQEQGEAPRPQSQGAPSKARDSRAQDAELEAIMLREFGPIKRPQISGVSHQAPAAAGWEAPQTRQAETYLVDAYNLIFFWPELKELATASLENARTQLARKLQNYAAFLDKQLVLVFDGYRVGGGSGERQQLPHLTLLYTKEHETADMAIERLLAERKKGTRLAVVSNDNLIRLATIRQGALRIRCEEFVREYETAMDSLEARMAQQGGRIGSRISWEETSLLSSCNNSSHGVE